jgi:hypothetical protein
MPRSSRFVAVTRRSFMKGSLGAGLLLAFPLAACGNDDASTFTESPTTSGAATTAAASAAGSTGTSLPSTAPAVATPAPVASSAAAGATTAAGAMQLRIDFTFAAAGDRVENPYIAVWIEDSSGALLRTISVWFSDRKSKYLDELKRWYTVDDGGRADGAIDTVSGGSRTPGSYTVSWDGTDGTGAAVTAGDYFVCIEAAREHGPYELVRQSVAIGSSAFTKQLTPSGELTVAAVQLVV